MKKVAKKYNSYKYIQFNSKIVGAHWHEEKCKWKLQIQRGEDEKDIFEDEVDVFLNAGGILKLVPEIDMANLVNGNGLQFLDYSLSKASYCILQDGIIHTTTRTKLSL